MVVPPDDPDMRHETIYFIDGNPTDRRLIQAVLHKAGYSVRSHTSAEDFLHTYAGDPGCLLLDVCLPGMDGPELQERLAQHGYEIPIVFLSGNGDVATVSQVFRHGAVDFLAKPFSPDELLASVDLALERDRERRREWSHKQAMLARLARLTPREREVMTHLVRSRTAREIGEELGLSPKTVQVHRAHILEKTEARSVIALTRLAFAAGIEPVAEVEVGESLTK